MWRRLIRSTAFGCEFAPGVTEAELAAAEAALGIPLPADLASVLRETNGASAARDVGLLWTLAEIVRVHRAAVDRPTRTDTPDAGEPALPAERLLCFAGERGGGRYAYAIADGAVRGAGVLHCAPGTGRQRWVAPSLAAYLEARLDGTLPRGDGPDGPHDAA